MEWINISKIRDYESIEGKSILVWQENLADSTCSRFQRAIFYKDDLKSYDMIQIYPNLGDNYFLKSDNYINYDLEGDKCQITHFAIVDKPNIDNTL